MGFEALLVVLLTLSTQSKKAETFRFLREILNIILVYSITKC